MYVWRFLIWGLWIYRTVEEKKFWKKKFEGESFCVTIEAMWTFKGNIWILRDALKKNGAKMKLSSYKKFRKGV